VAGSSGTIDRRALKRVSSAVTATDAHRTDRASTIAAAALLRMAFSPVDRRLREARRFAGPVWLVLPGNINRMAAPGIRRRELGCRADAERDRPRRSDRKSVVEGAGGELAGPQGS